MTQAITQEQWAQAGFGQEHPPTTLQQANDRITFMEMIKKLDLANKEVKEVRKLLVERNMQLYEANQTITNLLAQGLGNQTKPLLTPFMAPGPEGSQL